MAGSSKAKPGSRAGKGASSDAQLTRRRSVKAAAKTLQRNMVNPRMPGSRLAPFEGVSEMEVAPVSLGNTVRSVKQVVLPTADGVRVVGRDFVMAVGGTAATFTTWCLQGGMALSPVSLNASGLRGFFQTYERFKWNKAQAHYITSSPTSLSGDILLMYHSNHGGPKVNHTSSNFLSYALSTDSALIGPQWSNHSVDIIRGTHDWFGTDVFNAEDVQHQADGELLVYTRNTTNGVVAENPGYLLIDYDISFQRRMLNPRVQTLPSAVFKWFPTAFNFIQNLQWDAVAGAASVNSYTGANQGLPQGAANGDVYQLVIDLTNANNAGGLNLATMWSITLNETGNAATSSFLPQAFPVTTGLTVYGVVSGTSISLAPNYDAIMTGKSIRWSAAGPNAISFPVIMCCVGSVSPNFTQANIG